MTGTATSRNWSATAGRAPRHMARSVLYEQWKPQRIRDYSQLDKKRQDKLLNNYLYCDEENRYRFKRRLPYRKLYGIIKLMFDRGYFVGKMDYQAYWFFYECLAPNLEGIPSEDIVVLE